MSNVLTNVVIQLLYFIGSVYLVGFLISKLSTVFYRMFASKTLCYVLGVIGTPIHEISHAIMCLIFGHKITDMKLFQVDENDNKLGYVVHTFNPKNPYHQIGNYFIGVAPILVGTLIICFLMRIMMPDAFIDVSAFVDEIAATSKNGFSFGIIFDALRLIVVLFGHITEGLMWLLFVVITACISMHMSLSGADIKGSVKAIPLIAVVLFVANFLVYIVSKRAYSAFVNALTTAGMYLISILLLSLLFAGFIVLIAFLIKLIIGIFKK